MNIGYHASHEQFKPGALLNFVKKADRAGFSGCLSSDHFHPWSSQQGESGFAWSWLGAALEATKLSCGVVNAPGYRYHPAIVAQAAATLSEMYPERLWVALGSGELLNEGIVGQHWPVKTERNKRLLECAGIMRRLWAGEKVTSQGYVVVEEAKLYTLPTKPPLLLGAAITPATAEWMGGWADGLITVSRPIEELRKVAEAFRRGGGQTKPMYLKVQVSYDLSEEDALQGAWEQWYMVVHGSSVITDLRSPEQFEDGLRFVKPEQVRNNIHVSNDLRKYVNWLKQYFELGFENIYLHNINRKQEQFIQDFGAYVLPELLEGEPK